MKLVKPIHFAFIIIVMMTVLLFISRRELDYRPPTDNRPMQYWVICRTNSLTAKAPHYRAIYPGLDQKSKEEQSHYWRNVAGRLKNIHELQVADLAATVSDEVWVYEKLISLTNDKNGYVDQETWKVIGQDPEGKGINSPAARLKRHWLTLMFLDPEAAEEFNKSIRPPHEARTIQFELDRLKESYAMLQALGRNSSPPF